MTKKLLLPFVLCLLTFLTGCVRYDFGVNFDSQHRGAIVQHIKLGEQLTSFDKADAKKWLTSIEDRARDLQGKIKQISPEEIVVTIPFNNGSDLASKFNKFFNPNFQQESPSNSDISELVPLNFEMSLNQSNALLLERNRLSVNIDLRALEAFSEDSELVIAPSSLIDLEFSLNTPWGSRNLIREDSLTPEINTQDNQLVWKLEPGQINYIEAVFWVPSFLGIGTLFIILLIVAGFYFKYKRFPLINYN